MEKGFFKSLINSLRIEEVEGHKYLCELIEVLDKKINKEINLNIYSKNFEIEELEKQKKSSSDDKTSDLLYRIVINSLKGVKTAYISWKNILWSALFLSIYSNYESKLNQICLIIMEMDNLELSPKDLKDSGLTRTRKYLHKVAKYNFSITDEKWLLSEKYNKIRNIITHNEGKLEKSKSKYKDIELHNFIISHEDLSIDKLDRIIMTKNFVLETERYFYNIYLIICDELVGL